MDHRNDDAGDYKTLEELNEELLALKLRIAYKEKEDIEIERLIAECEESDPELDQRFDEASPRIWKRVNHGLRRKQTRKFMTQSLPKAGKIAASILLVFYLGLTTAIATVQSVRMNMLRFIVSIEEQYTSLGFEKTDETMDVPADWEGYYYPAYIPEGYVFDHLDWYGTVYLNGEGSELSYSEFTASAYTNIDTENALVENVYINSQPGLLVEKRGHATVVWSTDNRYFIVSVEGPRDDALQVAISVKMIR